MISQSELQAAVASLGRIGGVYNYVAAYVEYANAPYVVKDQND